MNFQDTAEGNNWVEADFEIVEYKDAAEEFVAQYRPRSLADGAWTVTDENAKPGEDSGFGGDVSGNQPGNGENPPADDGQGTDSSALITLPATYGKTMVLYSSYSVGTTNEDGGVAEIVKFNKENRKMYVVSGQLQSVDIVDVLANGGNRLYRRILVGKLGEENGFDAGDITSVDVNTTLDIIALAVQSSDYTAAGHIVLLDYEGNYITKFRTGAQPDMITFSPDGRYVMTADEGEPREGYSEGGIDPKGSVTLVTLNAENLAESEVKVCDLTAFDAKRDTLVADRVLLKKDTAPGVDLEPEYIAVTADSSKAYVSLQENNAIATLDLQSGSFIAVKGLGFKDYSLENNAIDLNKDGKINIQTEEVYGVYMPGGRSCSIFRADTMEQVYDSGADFEKITATTYPDYFNSNHKEADLEGRSNKKGPEPEDVKTLAVGDKIYAFIGLERVGGIMMYDITNPQAPVFTDYINHRDFSEKDLEKAGDIGAEGICTIEAQYSPTGYPMVLVANEISGTVSVIGLTEGKYEPSSGDSDSTGDSDSAEDSGSTEEKEEAEEDSNDSSVYAVDWSAVIEKTDAVLLQAADAVENQNAGIPETLTKQLTEGTLTSRIFAMEEKTAYPTKVNVHFTFDRQYSGKYANLYSYDETSGKMKYQSSYLITQTGQAMFAFPKGDEFIVTVTEKRP